jgi:hypothetical protein
MRKLIIILLFVSLTTQAQKPWKELAVSTGLVLTESVAQYLVLKEHSVVGYSLEGLAMAAVGTRIALDVRNEKDWSKNLGSYMFLKFGIARPLSRSLAGLEINKGSGASMYSNITYGITKGYCLVLGIVIAIK